MRKQKGLSRTNTGWEKGGGIYRPFFPPKKTPFPSLENNQEGFLCSHQAQPQALENSQGMSSWIVPTVPQGLAAAQSTQAPENSQGTRSWMCPGMCRTIPGMGQVPGETRCVRGCGKG